jgi:selenocysteine lyase/cysteine desulfurase
MNTQSIEYQDVVEITEELDRSGVVCLEDVVSPEWLMQARADITTFLAGRGMICSWRHGLRVAPHLYNTVDEVERFMDAVTELAR